MNERIIEIILDLITRLRENETIEHLDFSGLASSGYTEAEIGAAFNWIAHRKAFEEQSVNDQGLSFRILHSSERKLFESSAYGYLIQLVNLGVLSALQMEAVIDNARIAAYEPVTIQDVQQMVSELMVESGDSLSYGFQSAMQAEGVVH